MKFKTILLTLILVLPGLSSAETEWTNIITGSAPADVNTTDTSKIAQPGNTYYYEFVSTDATTDMSVVLWISACRGGSHVLFWPSVSDTSTDAELQVYTCPNNTASETLCERVLVDIDGGGVDDLTLNGDDGSTSQQRFWITDITFPNIMLSPAVLPAVGDTARALVLCGQ